MSDSCINTVLNIITAIGTLGAVIVALFTSFVAMRELRKDRIIGQSPFLAFENGSISISKLKAINSRKQQHDLLKEFKWGKLINYGRGTAISITCRWEISALSEPSGHLELPKPETINPIQQNLLSGGISEFDLFLNGLITNSNTTIDGKVTILCLDSLGNTHTTIQSFSYLQNDASYYSALSFHSDIKYIPPYS